MMLADIQIPVKVDPSDMTPAQRARQVVLIEDYLHAAAGLILYAGVEVERLIADESRNTYIQELIRDAYAHVYTRMAQVKENLVLAYKEMEES